MKIRITREKLGLTVGFILTWAIVLSFIPLTQLANSQQQVIQKIEALVNDEVISGYDVGQRMGLVLLATGQSIQNEQQLTQLRNQVLTSLVDELLQVQEAREYEVPVPDNEIFETYARVAQGYNQTPDGFAEMLIEYGSSAEAIITQIRAEFAWQSLVNGRYGTQAEATEDEIDTILKEMEANAGQKEYRIAEINLIVGNPNQDALVASNAKQIRDQIANYAQFGQIARQFSQSTSAALGGDLGWISEGQLAPEILAVVKDMDILEISQPIKSTGGYYIVALSDRRTILATEAMDELLDLRQIGYFFNQETTEESAIAWFENAVIVAAKLKSCEGLPEMVENLGDVLYRDLGEISLKQLNPELRTILETVSVGTATEPINTPEGFIVFALCNKRMPEATLPTSSEIRNQIETQRIAMMGRRYLRDLRRDAIIDYK